MFSFIPRRNILQESNTGPSSSFINLHTNSAYSILVYMPFNHLTWWHLNWPYWNESQTLHNAKLELPSDFWSLYFTTENCITTGTVQTLKNNTCFKQYRIHRLRSSPQILALQFPQKHPMSLCFSSFFFIGKNVLYQRLYWQILHTSCLTTLSIFWSRKNCLH